MDDIFREIMVRAPGAQTRNMNFLENGFTDVD
jgi:hypothetical protein